MPDSVLVALDGSPLAERALTYALNTFPEAALTTICVIYPIDSVIGVEAGGLPVAEDWHDTALERATEIHTTATDLAAEHDVALKTLQRWVNRRVRFSNTLTATASIRSVWGATAGQVLTGRFSEVLPKQSPAEHGFQ